MSGQIFPGTRVRYAEESGKPEVLYAHFSLRDGAFCSIGGRRVTVEEFQEKLNEMAELVAKRSV